MDEAQTKEELRPVKKQLVREQVSWHILPVGASA
jgi:hypothetical protein